MLRYQKIEKHGGEFCCLPSVKTENGFCSLSHYRAPPKWQPWDGFLPGLCGAPSLGGRVQAPTGVWGVALGVCCARYVLLSLHRDSWRLMQFISVCSSVLSHAGRWAQPRGEKEEDDGGYEFRCLDEGMHESSVRKCWLALPQAEVLWTGVTLLVDIETETQSRVGSVSCRLNCP